MKPISALKKAIVTNLAKAKAQLAMLESTLMKCNKVVVFTDMLTTVTIDREKNKYVINGNVIATQFTEEAAKEIALNVTNGYGERPVIMNVKEYYKQQIEMLESLI